MEYHDVGSLRRVWHLRTWPVGVRAIFESGLILSEPILTCCRFVAYHYKLISQNLTTLESTEKMMRLVRNPCFPPPVCRCPCVIISRKLFFHLSYLQGGLCKCV
jgi:hypothetical protein